MSFSAHTSQMKKICAHLHPLMQANTTEHHVHALLEYICANEALFEASISKNSPFYAEFFTHICADSVHPELCFELLECLIIFCRERQLCTHTQNISAAEKELLDFYEQSQHWKESEHTLVYEWYWRTLPGQYGHPIQA